MASLNIAPMRVVLQNLTNIASGAAVTAPCFNLTQCKDIPPRTI